MERRRYFIGRLGREVGLTPQAIRYYERLGLIDPPRRTEARYRVYSEQDAARLRFIRRAQRLGLSLAEVKALVDLRSAGRAPCDCLKEMVRRRIAELDERICEMQALRDELARWLEERAGARRMASEAGVCALVEADWPAGRNTWP